MAAFGVSKLRFDTPEHCEHFIMYFIISYDVKNDRRRQKIHDLLLDYGAWVQYSVFECSLTKSEYLRLKDRLQDLLDKDEQDSIRFYSLCDECKRKIERIGGVTPPEYGTMIV